MERSLLVFVVGCGGFIGASLRYLISLWATKGIGPGFPFGTLIVNILGAIIIGFVTEMSLRTNVVSPTAKTFITTGMMGGLTTFSTFSLETITIFSHGNIGLGSLNIILNLGLSLVGVIIGQFIAKVLF
ncbi:fluoride efflux transporter CrcB [uncultured Clostridium sp.]|jgi:CrcB protein|uniref:fluoride efflux transporter CrcB n=1 Tax=uncultured Clostridium sp. TaxID=59620 RepID=UPI002604A64C|nr:fluoride efflux transporter CrcB [uncultured Clostridium sp.]